MYLLEIEEYAKWDEQRRNRQSVSDDRQVEQVQRRLQFTMKEKRQAYVNTTVLRVEEVRFNGMRYLVTDVCSRAFPLSLHTNTCPDTSGRRAIYGIYPGTPTLITCMPFVFKNQTSYIKYTQGYFYCPGRVPGATSISRLEGHG